MAGVLQHLRSSTLDKRPNPASMVDGQVAINYASGSPGMFFKDSNGDLVKVGPVHVGSTAPNVSPASGGTAGNSKGEQWLDTSDGTYVFKIWDGAAWRSEAGEFVNAAGDTMTGSLTMGTSANIIFEGSVNDGFETTLTVANPTADRTITLPNVTGTVVTTGDSGTVTSTMIADGTIVNADVNASAAIAGSKISPDFAGQNVVTTGSITGASLIPSSATVPTNGVYLPAANNVAISTNTSERVRVDSSGRLLVGSSASYNAPSITGTQSASINQIHSAIGGVGSQLIAEWSTSTANGGSALRLAKSNSGTVGSHAALTANQDIGSIVFAASDGTNFINAASILSEVDGTSGVNDMPGRLVFSTTADGESSPTERMRINNAGNVGIGTTSPNYLLDCQKTGSQLIRSRTNDTGSGTSTGGFLGEYLGGGGGTNTQINIAAGNNYGLLSTLTNSPLLIGTNGTEKLRIDASGRVLIGATTNTGSRLSVVDFSATSIPSLGSPGVLHVGCNTGFGLSLGTRDTGVSYIQSQRVDGTATAYSLLLNPAGGSVGVGTTSPSDTLHVAGGARFGANDTSTAYLEVGAGATGNRSAFIDLIGDTTYSDFGLRLSRGNSGANTNSELRHRGTGSLILKAQDSGSLVFSTTNDERARIDSSGRLLAGVSSSFQIESLITPKVISASSAGSDDCADLFVGSFQNAVGSGRARVSGKLFLAHSRSGTPGSIGGLVGSSDRLGEIRFVGDDGTQFLTAAEILGEVDGIPGTSDMPGRLVFATTADGASSPTERMRIDNAGFISFAGDTDTGIKYIGTNSLGFYTANQERITIGATGGVGINNASPISTLDVNGSVSFSRDANTVATFNRNTDDGTLVLFRQDNTTEGSISVSGTTVSYNGAHLSRWSQLSGGAEHTEILRGTVLSNIDEMCEWGNEDNEQLNRMKVSDVEGDKNVSGVFQAWDDDDDIYTNDFYCAMTGDFVIRIAASTTVERGDLLMSAGDGTAKPQDDDIIRSKTIAKVTSTTVSCTYDDGSYCVPCVLMAC
jgi:hypothetical protein